MKRWVLVATAGLLAACAGGARREGAAPLGRPGESAAWSGKSPTGPAVPSDDPECASAQYRFTCAVPEGYLLTQEKRGPGTIMNFEKQVRGSEYQSTIALRVTPLGPKNTLETFVERRLARDLKKAQGVARLDKQPAEVGGKIGIELVIDREYASGPYRSRVFCFQEGANVFIVDQSVPAARFDREKPALDRFVESLSFEQL